jgi:sugar lactone lactonase YvrE
MQTLTASVMREVLSFGENPRWHQGRLWYSDFYHHGVYSMDCDGDERLDHVVDGQPSGLGWLPDGDLLCVSMLDHLVLRFHDDKPSLFCDISPYCGFWANDMITSATGVSYVGNFGFDLHPMLHEGGAAAMQVNRPHGTNPVVISRNGDVLQVVPDMDFPNGTVISPAGTTLMVGETLSSRLTAFDIAADGTFSNRRVWAQMEFVYTDGMCLDAESQIWLANAVAPNCLRVREGGEITASVETGQISFACMLGGEDRRSLYIMTAPTSDRFEIAVKHDGRIEIVEVAVPGAGLP